MRNPDLTGGLEGCGNETAREDCVRLLVLDGQALFRSSLSRLLASQPGFQVVGECAGSAEALEILGALPVDVVLLDFGCVTQGGDDFMSEARRKGYQGRFLIVTEAVDARRSAIAIGLGASGVFLRSESPDRLVRAIELVASGAVWLDETIIRLLADQSIGKLPRSEDSDSGNLLPDREQKVLLGVLGGLSNKKIGANLGISESTVKAALQRLFLKTGVRTRSQLVRVALEGSLKTAKGLMRHLRNAKAASSLRGELHPII